jgi:hypothetical protein
MQIFTIKFGISYDVVLWKTGIKVQCNVLFARCSEHVYRKSLTGLKYDTANNKSCSGNRVFERVTTNDLGLCRKLRTSRNIKHAIITADNFTRRNGLD